MQINYLHLYKWKPRKYCFYRSSDVVSFTITSAVVLAFCSVLTVGLSLTNVSSMSIIWMMFGQMRIFLLLLLQSGYVSEYVINYILGFKFVMFSFDFLKIRQLFIVLFTFVNSMIQYFDDEQQNAKLNTIGECLW